MNVLLLSQHVHKDLGYKYRDFYVPINSSNVKNLESKP